LPPPARQNLTGLVAKRLDFPLVSQSEITDPFLRERYGLRTNRWAPWVVPALVIGLSGGGWLIWSANHYSKPEIRSTLISFTAIDKSSMELRYSLNFRTRGLVHQCQLVARDFQANVVGELTDVIPAGSVTLTRTVRIPTRLLAVNAGIDSCRTGS